MKSTKNKAPYLIVIDILRLDGLLVESNDLLLSFGGKPDLFVTASVISNTGECFSRSHSSIFSQDFREWNEQIITCAEGSTSTLVINVFSRTLVSGDRFIGQAEIPLEHYASLDDKKSIAVNAGIHDLPTHPVFNARGEVESIVSDSQAGGVIRLKLTIPTRDNALCDWFFMLFTNFFGISDSIRVWVVLFDDKINIFSDKFGGNSTLIRTILKSTIVKVDVVKPESLAVKVDALEVTLKPGDGYLTGEVVRLLWQSESNMQKVFVNAFILICISTLYILTYYDKNRIRGFGPSRPVGLFL